MTCGLALFVLLAGIWCVSIPDPAWGLPVGLVALAAGVVLLGWSLREAS